MTSFAPSQLCSVKFCPEPTKSANHGWREALCPGSRMSPYSFRLLLSGICHSDNRECDKHTCKASLWQEVLCEFSLDTITVGRNRLTAPSTHSSIVKSTVCCELRMILQQCTSATHSGDHSRVLVLGSLASRFLPGRRRLCWRRLSKRDCIVLSHCLRQVFKGPCLLGILWLHLLTSFSPSRMGQ